jgi:prolyl oligopeptidase
MAKSTPTRRRKVPLEFTISEAQAKRAMDPPYDNSLVEKLHGKKVSDPFRPMEDFTSEDTSAWVARQNEVFEKFVEPAEYVAKKTVEFLEGSIPDGERESMPSRIGEEGNYKYVVSRKAKEAARPSYYIKDVPDYGAPAELLLDPMEIDPSGKTAITSISFTRDAKTVAYGLSVSGSDENTLHFMDVETRKNLDLTYEKFRSGIRWMRDGSGFHYSRPMENLHKAWEVCYHEMGTEPENDKVIFSADMPETRVGHFRLTKDSTDATGTYEWISQSTTGVDGSTLLARPLGSDEDFTEIFSHPDFSLSPIEELNGKILAQTDYDAKNGKIVLVDMENPTPENWETVIPEYGDDYPLDGAFVWQDKIFVSYTYDTGDVMKVHDLEGKYLHDVPIPPLTSVGMGGINIDDPKCLITYDSFQEAGAIYEYDSDKNTLELYRESRVPIDMKDCIVERRHATSKDGTQVPMTVIRAPDTKLDGTAATLLYGYGGFDNPLGPYFGPGIAQWVRSGGIYVQANLRGGGEFGQEWYDGGRLENKQNVFDDFAACAQHLVSHKYTSPKRLAIQGGSNGGLLTLATMIQNPKLFGAVVSEVPVADMFRFHIGSFYGSGWMCDYGNPDVKKDFNVAAKYSPLHNVKPGMEHPPLLIKTDINDDRVQPWHSFKMAAMMQGFEDIGSKTWLYTRTDGGHGAGMTEKQRFNDVATVRAFLHQTLGPINQDEYKEMLGLNV